MLFIDNLITTMKDIIAIKLSIGYCAQKKLKKNHYGNIKSIVSNNSLMKITHRNQCSGCGQYSYVTKHIAGPSTSSLYIKYDYFT